MDGQVATRPLEPIVRIRIGDSEEEKHQHHVGESWNDQRCFHDSDYQNMDEHCPFRGAHRPILWHVLQTGPGPPPQ